MDRAVKNSLEIIEVNRCVLRAASVERGGRIRVAESVFEANCSRQMGQHKKKDLSPNVFVFTRGVSKVFL